MAERDVDIVISAINESDYAALQAHRRDHAATSEYGFEAEARALAKQAKQGHLALFLGAGTSVSAGLPGWAGLLDEVSGRRREEVHLLSDPLDQGELLRRELKGGLGRAVADATNTDGKHALSHSLLASLKCREVVTTNFDECYESAAVRDGLVVLPWSAPIGDEPWLLKMHGSRHKPESIVLARRDFVQFVGKSGPSGAILQALLMTRHLLVIGTSFTDSNLLRLVHEVAAFRDSNEVTATMGTVVTLLADPSRQMLLDGDFNYLAMTGPDEEPDLPAAARRLEIFLDVLAMYAARSSPHLLDERYSDLLTEPKEQDLADELRNLLPKARKLSETSDAWSDVVAALNSWGAADQSKTESPTAGRRTGVGRLASRQRAS